MPAIGFSIEVEFNPATESSESTTVFDSREEFDSVAAPETIGCGFMMVLLVNAKAPFGATGLAQFETSTTWSRSAAPDTETYGVADSLAPRETRSKTAAACSNVLTARAADVRPEIRLCGCTPHFRTVNPRLQSNCDSFAIRKFVS